MTIEQAINYLKSTGMNDEQIIEVADALTKGAISQLRAEMQALADIEWNTQVGSVSQGLEAAIEIIDKYAESEE